MGISIKDIETETLIRKLSIITGDSLTGVIKMAIAEKLERIEKHTQNKVDDELLEIVKKARRGRLKDTRTAEEILGYNDKGFPE